MQTLHPDSLSSQLVAWHNRHPLACRIGVQQVKSLGYVMLPFAAMARPPTGRSEDTALPVLHTPLAEGAAAEGSTLRERAMARAGQIDASPHDPHVDAQRVSHPGSELAQSETAHPVAQPAEHQSVHPSAQTASHPSALPSSGPQPDAKAQPLAAAFSEDFIRPLRPGAVAAFALQHGVEHAAPGKDMPVRMVKPKDGLAASALQPHWLLTAQIEVGGRRSRVLAGAGRAPAFLGKRLWSLPRLALAGALLLAVGAALALGLRSVMKPAATVVAPVTAAPAPTSALAVVVTAASAVGAEAAPLTAAAPLAASAASAASEASAASAPLATATQSQASTAARPTDVDPTWGRVDLPSMGARSDERRQLNLAARQAASTPAAATANTGAAATAPLQTAKAETPAAQAITGPAFALSSRLIRTRAESEQIADAMRGLLAAGGATRLQVEALRAGDDWRVVCWPYPSRAQADKARALLAARGMKVQVVDF